MYNSTANNSNKINRNINNSNNNKRLKSSQLAAGEGSEVRGKGVSLGCHGVSVKDCR